MIILDNASKSVQVLLGGAAATTEAPVYASYVDITGTPTITPASADAVTVGATPVIVVAAPTLTDPLTYRQVKFMSIYNADTAEINVTVRLLNGATPRILVKVPLAIGCTLQYVDGEGFKVFSPDNFSLGVTV